MKFDIVIITYKREELLKRCLESIMEQSPTGLEKIILVNNGGDDLHFSLPDIVEYFKIDKCYPAKARNFATLKCQNDWVLFLDDDVIVSSNYFKTAHSILGKSAHLDVLGGPDQSYPGGSEMQEALGLALMSPMTTGHTRNRHLINKTDYLDGNESNLILCHLWVKRSLFIDGFKFPENYFRNEENVFLERLRKSQKEICHKPELFVYHYRKDSIKSLFKATFISAYYRKKSLLENEADLNFFFFVPSLFFFSLIVGMIFVFPLFVVSLTLYLVMSLMLLIFTKGNFYLKCRIFGIQFIIHMAYGIGFICPQFFKKRIMR